MRWWERRWARKWARANIYRLCEARRKSDRRPELDGGGRNDAASLAFQQPGVPSVCLWWMASATCSSQGLCAERRFWGSMVARLNLEEVDGRAPPGVNLQLAATLRQKATRMGEWCASLNAGQLGHSSGRVTRPNCGESLRGGSCQVGYRKAAFLDIVGGGAWPLWVGVVI